MHSEPATSLASELVLCHVSVQTLPLADVIDAAGATGFDSIALLAAPLRKALRREGMTLPEISQRVADAGLTISTLMATGDWIAPFDLDVPRWMKPAYTTAEFLDIGAELGVRSLAATHFGAPVGVDEAAAAFARLCDGAAARGFDVILEFVPMATIADVVFADAVVSAANRPNGGLLVDTWHHQRGAATDAELFAVDPSHVRLVQISDGTAEPVGPLIEDVQCRVLPPTGELAVPELLRGMSQAGVRCPVSVEILDRALCEQGAEATARAMRAALLATLEAAR